MLVMSLWTNLIDDWGEESVVLWNISDYNDLSSLSIEMWRSLYSTYYSHTLHTAPCSSLVSSGPGSSLGSHQPLQLEDILSNLPGSLLVTAWTS